MMFGSNGKLSGADLDARRALNDAQRLLVLTMLMLDRHHVEHVLELLASSVRSVTRCELVEVRLQRNGVWTSWPGSGSIASRTPPGPQPWVEPEGDGWLCTTVIAAFSGPPGRLVLRSTEEPDREQLFVIERLGHLLGVAVADAELHERDRLRAAELGRVNDDLVRTVAALRQRQSVQSVFTELAATGDEAGLAASLSRLTGKEVVVRDAFGHVTTRAVAADPAGEVLVEALLDPPRALTGNGDGLVASVGGRTEFGTIALQTATDDNDARFALQYASTALGLLKAHESALAEMQNTLCRDLLEDLLEGLPAKAATVRARAQGHDLRVPHDVVVIEWGWGPTSSHPDHGLDSVRQALARQGLPCLVARQHGVIVVLAHRAVDIDELYQDLSRALGRQDGRVAMGEPAAGPDEIPRAYEQATRALTVRQQSTEPHGATAYTDLGVDRILALDGNDAEVERLITDWLGDLLAYDTRQGTDLVATLSAYLDRGGKYDQTAEALSIHRNTLRYRLARIGKVSGHDLGDVETRLNLHLATRAWRLRREPPRRSAT